MKKGRAWNISMLSSIWKPLHQEHLFHTNRPHVSRLKVHISQSIPLPIDYISIDLKINYFIIHIHIHIHMNTLKNGMVEGLLSPQTSGLTNASTSDSSSGWFDRSDVPFVIMAILY